MNAIQYFDWGFVDNTFLKDLELRSVNLSYYVPKEIKEGEDLQFNGTIINDASGKNFYTNSTHISVNYKEATNGFMKIIAEDQNRYALTFHFTNKTNREVHLEKISTNEFLFGSISDSFSLVFSKRQTRLLLNGEAVTEEFVIKNTTTQKTQRFKITAINR